MLHYSRISAKQSLKAKIQLLLDSGKLDPFFDTINGLLSLCTIYQYIHSTYDRSIWYGATWGTTSFCFHFYFLAEYIFRLYGTKDIRKYVFTKESLVDVISIVPYFTVAFIFNSILFEDNENEYVRLVNLFSLFRLLRFERFTRYIESDIYK